MNEILTIKEVADYLRLSRITVWRWCNNGKLPAFKVGRGWRIYRSEIEKIAKQNLTKQKYDLGVLIGPNS
ncbi:MAG: helix-turn-helix domain-containing protein [Ardenticatenaceae bacterium]